MTKPLTTIERLKRPLASNAWKGGLKWERKDLPIPRLEMFWLRHQDDDGFNLRCFYGLVKTHYLNDLYADDSEQKDSRIELHIFGFTRVDRDPRHAHPFIESQWDRRVNPPLPAGECLYTPFRDGVHARHDAEQLRLPLYVTTEDDDVAEWDPISMLQKLIRVGGKAL